jgi:predicted ABC-class ATPase
MNQLTVKKVEFYGDQTACVTLDSGISTITVFSHLCDCREGDKVDNLLRVLDAEVKTAYLSDWSNEVKREKSRERIEQTGPYSYVGCGSVVDRENGIIQVNGFCIEMAHNCRNTYAERAY